MAKKLLLFTGASGFLGENILNSLSDKYNVDSIGLSAKDQYIIDISKEQPVFKYKYDIVLHAAGKAHSVPKYASENQLFFDVNVQGTRNLCAALEIRGVPFALIFISSVAVYGLDSGENITEDHPLNGNSSYALSKIQAELFLGEWCLKNNVKLGIIRPPLIAGLNPPGNLGDMINAIKKGRYVRIGRGNARKSILMAEDISRVLPKLSEIGGVFNLCDDYSPSFFELESLISHQLGKKRILSIPYWFAKVLALIGDLLGNNFPINSMKLEKIVKSLSFSNAKAKRELKWNPIDVLNNFVI